MSKRVLVSALVALVSLPAVAQLAVTRFINLVDTPVSVTYDNSGIAQVPLDAATGTVITVAGYRKVSVLIGSGHATSFSVVMGKSRGETLMAAFTRPVSTNIQTFDVVGPDMALWLRGGTPGRSETVQLWVFLST